MLPAETEDKIKELRKVGYATDLETGDTESRVTLVSSRKPSSRFVITMREREDERWDWTEVRPEPWSKPVHLIVAADRLPQMLQDVVQNYS